MKKDEDFNNIIHSSHMIWKTGKTWKKERVYSIQGKVTEL